MHHKLYFRDVSERPDRFESEDLIKRPPPSITTQCARIIENLLSRRCTLTIPPTTWLAFGNYNPLTLPFIIPITTRYISPVPFPSSPCYSPSLSTCLMTLSTMSFRAASHVSEKVSTIQYPFSSHSDMLLRRTTTTRQADRRTGFHQDAECEGNPNSRQLQQTTLWLNDIVVGFTPSSKY